MGKAMNEVQIKKYRELIGWNDEDLYDFKTFCGLCALCERVLGPELYPQMPDKKFDPCHEVSCNTILVKVMIRYIFRLKRLILSPWKEDWKDKMWTRDW